MNQSFVLSQLRAAALAMIAFAAGKGWFSPADATFVTAMVTTLGPILVPYLLSIYANYNTVKVPSNSVAAAVAVEEVKPSATTASIVAVAKAAAPVLLALLFLTSMAHAQARAQSAPVTKAQATANPVLVLQKFTVGDLQAALDDATANNDTAGINCYTALIPVVQKGVANPLPKGLGAFQLLQKARDAKQLLANLQSPNGPLSALNIACAPLVMDVQNTLIQLGILGGAVSASGGLVLPFALPIALP